MVLVEGGVAMIVNRCTRYARGCGKCCEDGVGQTSGKLVYERAMSADWIFVRQKGLELGRRVRRNEMKKTYERHGQWKNDLVLRNTSLGRSKEAS